MFHKTATALLLVISGAFIAVPANAGLFESMTSQSSGTELPHPSEGYKPVKEFAVSRDKLIKSILEVFDENSISAESIDKHYGRIASGYVQGPTFSTAFGILGSNSTRYKFAISMSEFGRRATKLKIVAMLESSGNEVQSWRDVSADNREAVIGLEGWLYEQVARKVNGK